MSVKKVSGLYVILDRGLLGERDLFSLVTGIIRAGVRWIQYRDKESPDSEVAAALAAVTPLFRKEGAGLILNDRVGLVEGLGAAGVHLGRGDTPVREAREILGRDRVIGRTVRLVDEAVAAAADGADYLGVGAIYATATKPGAPVVGSGLLAEIRGAVTLPIVAIGGINASNLGEVLAAGADGIAVASAVLNAPEPAGAARELVEEITAFKRD